MAILVTGGLGYVGSHAVKQLVERGEEVISLDSLLFGHEEAACGSEVVIGDIGDKDLLRSVFSGRKIEAVMHFAALADVGESVADPQKYYICNIAKSLAMLEVMLEFGVKMMIFSSSAATFGEPEVVPIPEDHPKNPTNPTNPYGRSKLMLEEILREYEHAYGLRSISLRYFNASGADPSGLIGEDHTPEHHIIPLVLDVAMGKRDKFSIFGTDWPTRDGTCVRDYIHVTDLAQAHILGLDALRNGKKTTAYNMGNGNGYTVREVIAMAEEITGKKVNAVEAGRRPGDPAVLVASSEKITTELGFEPRFPELRTIIETAWRWQCSHPNGYDK
ncbi:MAG: UDP-glucose 4-epimerase GalE [Armatimonadetes bacterium]|nr:UDP-glucose 4-epimerase GalE [Armatimonadota bacterium]